MKKYVYIFLFLQLHGCAGLSQELTFEDAKELEVMQLKQIGKAQEFEISSDPIHRLSITYLGEFETSDETDLRLLNVVNFTGLTEDAVRANARLVVYSQEERIGYFQIGNRTQLPSKLTKDGKLIFPPREDCTDSNIIDISSQIPEKIFLKCKGDFGDLFELLKN